MHLSRVRMVPEGFAKAEPIAVLFCDSLFAPDTRLEPLFTREMAEQGCKLTNLRGAAARLLELPRSATRTRRVALVAGPKGCPHSYRDGCC